METNALELALEDLVMVEKPYNILEEVEVIDDGSLVAKVRNELLTETERGPMQCSEFGRHAAVLGSMLLAKNNPSKEKHFYLAGCADLRRSNLEVYESEVFWLKMSLLEQSRRKGKAYGELMDINGNVVYTGEVEYVILKSNAFHRLYSKGRVENSYIKGINPYTKRKSLKNVCVDEDKVTAAYGVVSVSECVGHFENYPCLPAAVIGGLFGDLGTHLLEHITGYKKMIGKSVLINARRLTFAGEFVHFEGRLVERKENSIVMYAEAFVGDEIIADVTTELVGVV